MTICSQSIEADSQHFNAILLGATVLRAFVPQGRGRHCLLSYLLATKQQLFLKVDKARLYVTNLML